MARGLCRIRGRLQPLPNPAPRNTPSFPRRRESWLILDNFRRNKILLESRQDSRLRGNDGIFCVAGCCRGLAKVSGRLNMQKPRAWLRHTPYTKTVGQDPPYVRQRPSEKRFRLRRNCAFRQPQPLRRRDRVRRPGAAHPATGSVSRGG